MCENREEMGGGRTGRKTGEKSKEGGVNGVYKKNIIKIEK